MASSDDSGSIAFKSLNIIPYRLYSGAENMAIDHFISASAASAVSPLIRFYGWNPWTISLGYHQSPSVLDEVSILENGYDIIRRPTGGRAIFHAEELTYSVIAPLESADRHNLYRWVHELLASAFQALGIPVSLSSGNNTMPHLRQAADDFPCFTRSAETEIQFEGCKVVGSAQKIYKQHILQHGSIMIDTAHVNLPDFLATDNSTKKILSNELREKTRALNQISKKKWSAQELSDAVIKELETNHTMSLNYLELNAEFLEQALSFSKNMILIS